VSPRKEILFNLAYSKSKTTTSLFLQKDLFIFITTLEKKKQFTDYWRDIYKMYIVYVQKATEHLLVRKT